MKLLAVVPISLLGTSNIVVEDRLKQHSLENAAILRHLKIWLDQIGVLKWRVTYKELWEDVQPPKGNLSNAQAVEIIRNCFEGLYYVILRDSTCRFIRLGQDGDLKLCLHSNDPVPEITSPLLLLKDMSPRLVDEDGSYDI